MKHLHRSCNQQSTTTAGMSCVTPPNEIGGVGPWRPVAAPCGRRAGAAGAARPAPPAGRPARPARGAAGQAAGALSGAAEPPVWATSASVTYEATATPEVRERYAALRDDAAA